MNLYRGWQATVKYGQLHFFRWGAAHSACKKKRGEPWHYCYTRPRDIKRLCSNCRRAIDGGYDKQECLALIRKETRSGAIS